MSEVKLTPITTSIRYYHKTSTFTLNVSKSILTKHFSSPKPTVMSISSTLFTLQRKRTYLQISKISRKRLPNLFSSISSIVRAVKLRTRTMNSLT